MDNPSESERLTLARVVRAAVLGLPDVADTQSGPSGVLATVQGARRVEGVLCVANRDGGYDVTIRLVCGLVPLHALAEQVKQEVRRAALGIGVAVHRIDVQVADVIEPVLV